MPNQPPRLSALEASCVDGSYGAQQTQPGIVLSERRVLKLIDIRGDPRHAEFLASAKTALGVDLPLTPNTSAAGPGASILWLGPDQWLIVGDRCSETLPITGGFLTDVSHGRTGVRIVGIHVRELLAKGCGLDLHPRAFPAEHCSQTLIAQINVLLHLTGGGKEFDLYFARSYADHLWHWLMEASSEFGYEIRSRVRSFV